MNHLVIANRFGRKCDDKGIMKMKVNEDVKRKLKKFLQYKTTSQFKQEQKIIKDLFETEDPRYAFKHNQS